jgi:hypothetical protein
MKELIQIISDAGQYYTQHEQEIKITAAALAIMAVPAYYTIKKAITKIGKIIDRADTEITMEQREYVGRMYKGFDRHNPLI